MMIGHIPHLTTLASRIRQASGEDSETQRVHDFYLEQLPYSIYAASNAVINLANAIGHAKDHVPPTGGDGEQGVGTILLPEPIKNQLSFPVGHYFDAARRVLNTMNIYLSKTLRLSVPASFSDLIKNMVKGKLQLPKRIDSLTINYWDADGKKIKAYRDLGQHHAVISSDARITALSNGRMFYYLVLCPTTQKKRTPLSCRMSTPE